MLGSEIFDYQENPSIPLFAILVCVSLFAYAGPQTGRFCKEVARDKIHVSMVTAAQECWRGLPGLYAGRVSIRGPTDSIQW